MTPIDPPIATPVRARVPALLALALAVLLALVLAACGSDDESGGGPTRSYTDATGATAEIPTEPRKVVALSEPTLDGLLALGVRPAGTTAGRGQEGVAAYLAEKARGIPLVASLMEPDLEKINAAAPDLIVVDGTTGAQRFLDKLRGIAPTVMVGKPGDDWRVAFKRLADVVGRAEQGNAVLDRDEQAVQALKADLGDEAGAVVSIARWAGDGPQVVGRGGPAATVLDELGMKRPTSQSKVVVGRSVTISRENLPQIDGDWLFFGALGSQEDAVKSLAVARRTPGFSKLRAVRSKHVVPVEGSAWNSPGGPLAVEIIVRQLREALVDGKGTAR